MTITRRTLIIAIAAVLALAGVGITIALIATDSSTPAGYDETAHRAAMEDIAGYGFDDAEWAELVEIDRKLCDEPSQAFADKTLQLEARAQIDPLAEDLFKMTMTGIEHLCPERLTEVPGYERFRSE